MRRIRWHDITLSEDGRHRDPLDEALHAAIAERRALRIHGGIAECKAPQSVRDRCGRFACRYHRPGNPRFICTNLRECELRANDRWHGPDLVMRREVRVSHSMRSWLRGVTQEAALKAGPVGSAARANITGRWDIREGRDAATDRLLDWIAARAKRERPWE